MKRLTTEQFIERAKNIHSDKYNYEIVVYTTAKAKVNIICPKHGIFLQEAFSHLTGCGCPKCSYTYLENTEEFIKRAYKIHGDRYNYNKSIYIRSGSKITIICKDHGEYEQIAWYHLQGNGCPKCSGRGITTEEFITKAMAIHGEKYNYSRLIFEKVDNDVEIICNEHGSFWQLPHNHLKNMGCPKCGDISGTEKRTKTLEDFLKEAKHVHGKKYDYSLVDYKNSNDYIIIICEKHGEFKQTPASHLFGRGCKKCSHHVSKGETAWLDSLNIERRQVKMLLPDNHYYEFDGYDEVTNTIYEYYGDYWHGNPNRFDLSTTNTRAKLSFKELYERTMNREAKIKQFGFNIITMWEAEWTKWKSS